VSYNMGAAVSDNDRTDKRAVCTCDACSGTLEFDISCAGSTTVCPHCGMETMLFIPTISRSNPRASNLPTAWDSEIITTTSGEVSGRPIERYLGVVRGIVVRSPTVAQGMLGGLKQVVGGNIESYAAVCEQARRQAFERMIQHARKLDADAVICFRYDATEFAPGVTEVLAYGTAVKLSQGPGYQSSHAHP
jgi:uncharacterized protein YbjQ (UPF0145 family)